MLRICMIDYLGSASVVFYFYLRQKNFRIGGLRLVMFRLPESQELSCLAVAQLLNFQL